MLTALQQAIAELQAGRREDHVKMETQQERIEELQAENRAQNAKIEKRSSCANVDPPTLSTSIFLPSSPPLHL